MNRLRVVVLLVCASLVSACAGSMQAGTTASGVIKRPVRASKGSVEKSATAVKVTSSVDSPR